MKVGPYETGRVYQGDCLDLMKAIPDGSIPMIWTDPPYGCNQNDGDLANKVIGSTVGFREREDLPAAARPILNDGAEDTERVVRGMLGHMGRVLAPVSAVCCCCGGGGPVPMFARVADWIADAPGMEFFHAVVWDKGMLGMGWRYRRCYEFVMVAKRRGQPILWAWPDNGQKTSNVVRIVRRINEPKDSDHPTPKPVELVRHFLELHTQPGQLVLDPFAGGGTTGVACAQLGREFLGFELDPRWVGLSNDRISAAARGLSAREARAGQTTFPW